jgi:hypothetical protein
MIHSTFLRYEVVRNFRNWRFLFLSLAFPLVLYFAIASSNRHATFNGIAFTVYFMAAMTGPEQTALARLPGHSARLPVLRGRGRSTRRARRLGGLRLRDPHRLHRLLARHPDARLDEQPAAVLGHLRLAGRAAGS